MPSDLQTKWAGPRSVKCESMFKGMGSLLVQFIFNLKGCQMSIVISKTLSIECEGLDKVKKMSFTYIFNMKS